MNKHDDNFVARVRGQYEAVLARDKAPRAMEDDMRTAMDNARYEAYRQQEAQELQRNTLRSANLANNMTISSTNRYGLQNALNSFDEASITSPQSEVHPDSLPAYAMPLSELRDLWCAAHGVGWVRSTALKEDFWTRACTRLGTALLLEKHGNYYRIRLEK